VSFEEYLAIKVAQSIAFVEMMIPRWEETKEFSPSSKHDLKVQVPRLCRLKKGELTEQDIGEYKQLYEQECRWNEMRINAGMSPLPIFREPTP
jgi:hypothetical protein